MQSKWNYFFSTEKDPDYVEYESLAEELEEILNEGAADNVSSSNVDQELGEGHQDVENDKNQEDGSGDDGIPHFYSKTIFIYSMSDILMNLIAGRRSKQNTHGTVGSGSKPIIKSDVQVHVNKPCMSHPSRRNEKEAKTLTPQSEAAETLSTPTAHSNVETSKLSGDKDEVIFFKFSRNCALVIYDVFV